MNVCDEKIKHFQIYGTHPHRIPDRCKFFLSRQSHTCKKHNNSRVESTFPLNHTYHIHANQWATSEKQTCSSEREINKSHVHFEEVGSWVEKANRK